MTRPSNPYQRGTYEHQLYADAMYERETARQVHDVVLGNTPEAKAYYAEFARTSQTALEPRISGPMSAAMRETARRREIEAEMAAENRGEMREPDPDPEWVKVTAWHDTAGRLTLMTNGAGWILHHRGVDFGIGDVWGGEIHGNHLTPRPEIIEAAAQRALADPWGPEAPPDSPLFVGGPDGEPVEMTLRELHERETAAAQPPPSTNWLSNLLSRKEN